MYSAGWQPTLFLVFLGSYFFGVSLLGAMHSVQCLERDLQFQIFGNAFTQ